MREPRLATYDDLAGILDLPLLNPEFSEEQIAAGCTTARALGLASVIVRPTDVELVAGWMKSSAARVGTVIGWPYGNTTTPVKLYEIRDLARRGAREFEAMINIGKMISRQFAYIETEVLQLVRECREADAALKLVIEPSRMALDLRVIAIRIARRAEVDFISVGGSLSRTRASVEDLGFVCQRAEPLVKVKAAWTATLDDALAAWDAGCSRLSTADPDTVLEAWKARLAEEAARSTATAPAS